MVDELRIERVIANLLDNALKYTPASASIVVRLSGDRETAHVSICDAGPGLSSAEIGFVFEPYRRALSSAGQSGSGLGLYVSKQIVEAHGGYIGVDSARGAGARFYILAPDVVTFLSRLRSSPNRQDSSIVHVRRRTRSTAMRGRILIVDDETNTAGAIAASLQQRGYSADGVTSAHACLDRIERVGAEIVVADVAASGMSGIELCSDLRERIQSVLPIVVTGASRYRRRDRRDPRRRLRLHDQAGRIEALEVALAARARSSRAQARARAAARSADRATAVRRRSSARAPRCSESLELIARVAEQRRDGAHHRRDRHRQGARRARASTTSRRARTGRSSRSTARRPARRSSRASCSATCAARSPTPRQRAHGLFVQAGGGTLFLDEIGEMPLEMQAKLLRALQERTVRPVGGDEEIAVRRAHRRGDQPRPRGRRSTSKRFREDLFYRINVVAIHVPPLRERGERHPVARAVTSSSAIAARIGKPVAGISAPTPRACCSTTTGPATCASSRTAWSARSRSRARSDHRRRSAGEAARIPDRGCLMPGGVARRARDARRR